jgi:hypothetical protein
MGTPPRGQTPQPRVDTYTGSDYTPAKRSLPVTPPEDRPHGLSRSCRLRNFCSKMEAIYFRDIYISIY